jgi:hypothetical protein
VLTLAGGGVLAQPAAAAKTPAPCRGGLGGAAAELPPAQLPGALEAPVLAGYAVFARAQLPSDLLPPVNTAGVSLEFRMASYYAGEIRQLMVLPNGRRYLAVPGFLRTFIVPPAICLPKQVRKYRAELVKEETRRRTQPAYCVVEVGSGRGGFDGGDCALFGEVPQEQALFSAGFGPGSRTTVSIVPNGVSAVRVVYPHGPTVTAPVRENAFMLDVPVSIQHKQRKVQRQLERVPFPKHPSRAQRHALQTVFARLERRLQAETEPLRVDGGRFLAIT